MSDALNQSTSPHQPGLILIVENDIVFREVLATHLARAGYTTVQTANGLEALNYLRMSPSPALILLDMFMPVMDGWTWIRECRRFGLPLPPVIIMTALEIAMESWARALGAVGLLRKPFDAETLLKEVGRHC